MPSHRLPTVGRVPNVSPPPMSTTAGAPPVEIRASTRRRKTVVAHWEGDGIVVVVPHRMPKAQRQAYAEELVAKLLAKTDRARPTDEALAGRAGELATRFLGGRVLPTAVTWSARQRHRWASCSPADRTIRVSDRLQGVPSWVLDAVLLHELAHLLHADHGEDFRRLTATFPRTVDADVFLAGYALGLDRGGAPAG